MPDEPSLSRMEALKGLRLSIYEGLWATVFAVLTGGAFQIGFARHLGANDFVLGLLAGLPAAVGLLQIPASLYVEKRGERRRFVAFSALGGRLALAAAALLPLLIHGDVKLTLFLLLLVLSSALLTMTVPAWTSWMSDMVPSDARGRYFARRNMLASIITMLAPLPAGWFLDHSGPERGFPVLFGLSAIAALACFTLILRQPEPKMVRRESQESPWHSLAAPLADPNFRTFLTFAGSVVMGQTVAGQFFVAWMVDKDALALPYLPVQMLGALAAGAGLATMPLWGYLADKYGGRPVLMLGSWGVLSAPLFWFFTLPGANWLNYPLGVILNVLSGAAWAAVGLTQFNLLLSLAPGEKRATYVAVYSAITGVIGGISPIIGGALMAALRPVHLELGPVLVNNFKLMFVLTELIRIGSLVLLRRVKDQDSHSTRFVLGQLVGVRPVTSYRTLQRLAQPLGEFERRDAVRSLGEQRSSLAVEELIAALDDVSFAVRESAARSLGEIKDARAVPALAAKLADPAAGIGEQAAYALGFIGDWAATPALMEAARGPDAMLRIAALRALARLADPAATPVLIAALNPERPTRCESACAALAAIGTDLPEEEEDTAKVRLLALLEPQIDRGMRLAAARTLEALAPVLPGVGEALLAHLPQESDPAVLAQLSSALARTRVAISAFPVVLAALDRLEPGSLAYLQAVTAAADTVLEPGTFYPYLALAGMARDEAVSKLVGELGKQSGLDGLLESFSAGAFGTVLEQLATAHPAPVLSALAARGERARVEEVLLALLWMRQDSAP